jgi:hypothetical protein
MRTVAATPSLSVPIHGHGGPYFLYIRNNGFDIMTPRNNFHLKKGHSHHLELYVLTMMVQKKRETPLVTRYTQTLIPVFMILCICLSAIMETIVEE